jgi:hypothetical protein
MGMKAVVFNYEETIKKNYCLFKNENNKKKLIVFDHTNLQ